MTTKTDTRQSADLELTITRIFDAPRELVFKAWTEHDRLMQWLCPKNFTVLFAEMDLRPGGAWRSGMRSPEGEEYVARGVYREIVEPERLVFTHAWEDEQGKPGNETLVTVTLAERGEKTMMTFAQAGLLSVDSRDSHAEGWNEAFDNLSAHLA